MKGNLSLNSSLTARRVPLIERPPVRTLADAIRYGTPQGMTMRERLFNRTVRQWRERNAANFDRSLVDQFKFEKGIRLNRIGAIGHLWLAHIKADGDVVDYGLVSCRVVTDAGAAFVVDSFQGTADMTTMKYHGLGTGTTAESASQTALVTELTTQYSSSNTRPTGTTGEGATANIYQSVATITVGSSVAATEHGLFNQASNAGGTMMDRSVFSVVNLGTGESLQTTYELTFGSGS